METRTETVEEKSCEVLEDWQKPTVKELDITTITLTGFTGAGSDFGSYS